MYIQTIKIDCLTGKRNQLQRMPVKVQDITIQYTVQKYMKATTCRLKDTCSKRMFTNNCLLGFNAGSSKDHERLNIKPKGTYEQGEKPPQFQQPEYHCSLSQRSKKVIFTEK